MIKSFWNQKNKQNKGEKMTYKDSHGVSIKEGDILKYEEGCTKSIDEVVLAKGQLYTCTHVGYPKWSKRLDSVLIPIHCIGEQHKLDDDVIQLKSFKITGNIVANPERLEPKYAEELWQE